MITKVGHYLGDLIKILLGYQREREAAEQEAQGLNSSHQEIGDDLHPQELINQLNQIEQRFYGDVPSFGEMWNYLVEEQAMEYHPELFDYTRSLTNVCQQALYAIECLRLYSSQAASNVYEFYVAHHFYDFFVRVKTATDILALMINHLFGLGLDDKACSLEGGKIVSDGGLRKPPPDQRREELAKMLDRARNWVKPFDDVRDRVIHRAGLKFTGGISDDCYIHIEIPLPPGATYSFTPGSPDSVLTALEPFADQEPMIKLLTQIGSRSISKLFGHFVDPVKFCDDIWGLLSSLIEGFCKEYKPEIESFILSGRGTGVK